MVAIKEFLHELVDHIGASSLHKRVDEIDETGREGANEPENGDRKTAIYGDSPTDEKAVTPVPVTDPDEDDRAEFEKWKAGRAAANAAPDDSGAQAAADQASRSDPIQDTGTGVNP